MTEVAAHLVDRVIPIVPIRQVVVSFPFRARVPLGYDAALSRATMAAVSTVLLRWLARRAKHLLGLPSVSLAHAGGIAFQQRFDSSLRLNPHLHVLLTDGVFVDQPGTPRFFPLPPPDPDELADLASLPSTVASSSPTISTTTTTPPYPMTEPAPVSWTDGGEFEVTAYALDSERGGDIEAYVRREFGRG